MAPRLFHIAFAAALSAACLLACHRKEDTPEGHTPSFTVNGKAENFTLQLLATGQTASLQIQSSEEWSVRGADVASWLAVSQPVQEKEHQWTLGLSAEVNEQEEPRQARLVFTCDTLSLTLTLQQDALDPMLRNPVPGFYGTEGGDLQLDLFRHQSSLFDNGEGPKVGASWTFPPSRPPCCPASPRSPRWDKAWRFAISMWRMAFCRSIRSIRK